jgi:hypothetical protein
MNAAVQTELSCSSSAKKSRSRAVQKDVRLALLV